ncbi:unnamed protein product [Blepharisma stoltei]|uniref:Ribosomal protein L32 n=1 Tax=Blepharisma stoltei TaxID=1481888 RepID=A0AAU9I7U5_9CILI|nr:unnamed protein product [Blepharisma stoltei]
MGQMRSWKKKFLTPCVSEQKNFVHSRRGGLIFFFIKFIYKFYKKYFFSKFKKILIRKNWKANINSICKIYVLKSNSFKIKQN